MMKQGHKERNKGTLLFALAAIATAKWHTSQVQLLKKPPQIAARDVTARHIGPKPEDEMKVKEWKRERAWLNKNLCRGRKWSRLVEKFGSGILLIDTWYV